MRRCGDATDDVTFPWTLCCLESPHCLCCPAKDPLERHKAGRAGQGSLWRVQERGLELPLFPSLLHLSSPWLAFPSHERCPSELPLSVPTLKHRGCGLVARGKGLAEQQHRRGGCQRGGAVLFLHQLLHRRPSADTGPLIRVWGDVCVAGVPFLLPPGRGWNGPETTGTSCEALLDLSQTCTFPTVMCSITELPFQGIITHPAASSIFLPLPSCSSPARQGPQDRSLLPVLPSPSSLRLRSVCHQSKPVPT